MLCLKTNSRFPIYQNMETVWTQVLEIAHGKVFLWVQIQICGSTWHYGLAICLARGKCRNLQTLWVKVQCEAEQGKMHFLVCLGCEETCFAQLSQIAGSDLQASRQNNGSATMGIPGTAVLHAIITVKLHLLIWLWLNKTLPRSCNFLSSWKEANSIGENSDTTPNFPLAFSPPHSTHILHHGVSQQWLQTIHHEP